LTFIVSEFSIEVQMTVRIVVNSSTVFTDKTSNNGLLAVVAVSETPSIRRTDSKGENIQKKNPL